jgi:hypothetical protein
MMGFGLLRPHLFATARTLRRLNLRLRRLLPQPGLHQLSGYLLPSFHRLLLDLIEGLPFVGLDQFLVKRSRMPHELLSTHRLPH